MQRKKIALLVLAGVLALSLIASVGAAASGPPGVRGIVVFDSAVNEAARQGLLRHFGAEELIELPIINGKAVLLPDVGAIGALARMPGVIRVEEDVIVTALKGKPVPSQPTETLPWGVDRIDADVAWAGSTGTRVKVAIIDTGIDTTHPDLKVYGGCNFVSTGKKYDPTKYSDDNGHGTHVAGTVAALDNEIGVIGMAPEAWLYAVKVLDRTGSGYLSWVIGGIQWSIEQGVQVINMSLGTNAYSASFEEAVNAAWNAGIVVVAAAGNDGDTDSDDDVDYPARFASAIAVAATDKSDLRAPWSSDGPDVELSAPGVDILSTYKGGTYATASGTSMATPHVAGTAALIIANGVTNNNDVRLLLQTTADDLPPAGVDNYTGYGLVDADGAVLGTTP